MSDLARLLDQRFEVTLQRWAAVVASTGLPATAPGRLGELLADLRDALWQGTARGPRVAPVQGLEELTPIVLDLVEQANQTLSVTDMRVLTRFVAGAEHGPRDLLMQTPVPIAIVEGPEHRLTFANPAYRALVGDRDLVGRKILDALPELRGQGFDALLDRVVTTGETIVGDEVLARVDRSGTGCLEEAFYNFTYSPRRDARGQVASVLVSAVDVTPQVLARRRIEALVEQLRQSEEKVRRVVEASGAGLWDLDAASGVIDANARMVDLMGLPAGSTFTRESGLANLPDEDRQRVTDAVADALDGKDGGRYQMEFRTGGQHGIPRRWVESRAQVTFDEQGKAVRLAGVMMDITARKTAEEEQGRRLHESKARQQAEEANRLKDEFLSTISHELRTPLTSMLGWAHILRTGSLPSDRHAHGLATIERSAKAQAQLIDDLIDMSRILSGNLRLEVRLVDVASLVEAALDAVRPAAEARSLRLESSLDAGLAVRGDPDRFQQIVGNLLSNAIKFTPRGGRVQVVVRRRDASVEIVVDDTGQGIAAAFLPHVFDRFRQADGSITRAQGGLGLGLSIVWQLVELHGGTVTAVSEGLDRGSTFTVRLPLASTAPDRNATGIAAVSAAPLLLTDLRLLVVDDDRDTRELLTLLLEAHGARVWQGASAAEGRSLFEAGRPDAVVSDIGMPGEDGHTFLASLRARSSQDGGDVPAIALTAYARTEDRARALAAGFNAHISKPVDPPELIAVLAALTRTRRPPPR